MSVLRPAFVLLVLFTLLTGVIYPAAVTGIGKLLFSHESEGSLVLRDGVVVGSSLLAQPFDDPGYFWGRPSATPGSAYNGAASSGSNLGPSNPALTDAVKARVDALRAADPEKVLPVPVDLVTASGSGLDPEISPAAAFFQMTRVARARGLPEERVAELVASRLEERTFAVLGEPRVNVLLLNLALDEIAPRPHSPSP